MFVEAPDVTYFWRRKAPFEPSKCELPRGSGGMVPQEIFKKRTLRNVVAFLESKYQFPRKGWSSLKSSLKVKIVNGNWDKWWRMGEGGWPQQNFQFFIIMVTEVNLNHQGQNQRLNHHFLCQNQIKSITSQSPRAAVAIPTFGYSFHFSNRCSTNMRSVFFS